MQRKFNYHAQTLKNFQIVHYVGLCHRQFLRKYGEWSLLLWSTVLNTCILTITYYPEGNDDRSHFFLWSKGQSKMLRILNCSPWKALQNCILKSFLTCTFVWYQESQWSVTDPILSVWSPNSKLTLVHSKSYESKLYYIPFDASRRALQGGIFGFSILNGSPYPTGSLKDISCFII
jgi:hypothetical protein